MMAEYTGITVSNLSVLLWRDYPFLVPYQWYAQQSLDQPPLVSTLVLNMVLQIVSEVIVDSICMYVEEKRGSISSAQVWNALGNRSFLILYGVSAWFTTVAANGFVRFSDNTDLCKGENVCCCMNKGLVQGGVYEAYCNLIYPNVSWDRGLETCP